MRLANTPSKHKQLGLCWLIIGTPSAPLAQHQTNIGPMYCVCCTTAVTLLDWYWHYENGKHSQQTLSMVSAVSQSIRILLNQIELYIYAVVIMVMGEPSQSIYQFFSKSIWSFSSIHTASCYGRPNNTWWLSWKKTSFWQAYEKLFYFINDRKILFTFSAIIAFGKKLARFLY